MESLRTLLFHFFGKLMSKKCWHRKFKNKNKCKIKIQNTKFFNGKRYTFVYFQNKLTIFPFCFHLAEGNPLHDKTFYSHFQCLLTFNYPVNLSLDYIHSRVFPRREIIFISKMIALTFVHPVKLVDYTLHVRIWLVALMYTGTY